MEMPPNRLIGLQNSDIIDTKRGVPWMIGKLNSMEEGLF
jgi:hypothetical protein